jgi:hypothetical protein
VVFRFIKDLLKLLAEIFIVYPKKANISNKLRNFYGIWGIADIFRITINVLE